MVSKTNEKQVITKAAYVLFYRRRDFSISLPKPIAQSSEDKTSCKKDKSDKGKQQPEKCDSSEPEEEKETQSGERRDDSCEESSDNTDNYLAPSPFTDMDSVD